MTNSTTPCVAASRSAAIPRRPDGYLAARGDRFDGATIDRVLDRPNLMTAAS
ncbi:hypothetical protein [Kitasatospora sp. NPDC058190]|uniref:hypothetical protein n=1 Tax=Kitasatospora sp. NPDC058190 TaxID=3346371 RepID=UPI0036DF1B9A